MDKRTLLMEAYENLLKRETDKDISISQIAKEAQIAKGGVYYYFKSKEELLDALLEKNFRERIKRAGNGLSYEKSCKDKIVLFFKNYIRDTSTNYLDNALHSKSNAYLHQKSLVFVVREFSEVIEKIIREGIVTGEFRCDEPYPVSLLLMGTLAFLLDYGLFTRAEAEYMKIAKAAFENFSYNIGLSENIFKEIVK